MFQEQKYPLGKLEIWIGTGSEPSIDEGVNATWMVGGTASKELLCELRLDKNDQVITYKLSELHHVDV